MNTLILECKKFIRSRIFVVILGVILVLLAKVFTFFETNKLKIVKRGKVENKVF